MTLKSNIPSIQVTETGVSVPETAEVLAGALSNLVGAFGSGLNVTNPATPQGYLAQEKTATIMKQNAAIALLFNLVDPAFSYGRMQDAIGRIYFISRKPATFTTVEALCTGIPFKTLPKGSQARSDTNEIYESTADAVFNAGGLATVQFICTKPGPIACGAGELSRIAVAVPGVWDAITNPAAGVLGSYAESRLAFERRREQSVSINSSGTTQAVYSNVAALDEVIDAYCVDNPSGEEKIFGVTNYPMKPHSLTLAVVGGDDDEIARVLFERKDAGCDMNGNKTIRVTDETPASNNKPVYDMVFLRPAHTPIKFNIQIKKNASLPSDVISQTKAAVISAFNGGFNGKDRERIAGTIFASQYYAPVAAISANMSILSIDIGFVTADQVLLTVGIDQFPTVGEDDITVELVT